MPWISTKEYNRERKPKGSKINCLKINNLREDTKFLKKVTLFL